MRHHSSITARFLFVSAFALFTLTATAQQFKKPIISPRDRNQASDARWNVGLVGGGNFTTWLHIHSAEASNWSLKNYSPVLFDTLGSSLGYFGGVAVEYMLKNNVSVGLNVIYAQHNMMLGFVDDHFPYGWTGDNINFIKREKYFSARYRAIEAYIPVTYYMSLAGSKNVKPYAYVAPRVSYIIPNDSLASMTHKTVYMQDSTIISSSTNSVEFNSSTYRNLNVGLTLGVGSLFRINAGKYYFLVKFDISANMTRIPTFTKGEVANNEFNHLRYSADAHASLTIMLPLKKQLQGACMKWGEYD